MSTFWKKSGILGLMLVLGLCPVLSGCGGEQAAEEKLAEEEEDPYWDESESYESEFYSEEETYSESEEQISASPDSDSVPAGENEAESTSLSSESDLASYTDDGLTVEEDGTYISEEEVALYLYSYGHLPSNFITKKEAKELGWDSSKGNLDEVAPGMSIGGDRFGNYEEILPVVDGRKYYECDINYTGGYRGSDRIIYSNEGQIYYTGDHYKTFELLYGEE